MIAGSFPFQWFFDARNRGGMAVGPPAAARGARRGGAGIAARVPGKPGHHGSARPGPEMMLASPPLGGPAHLATLSQQFWSVALWS